MADNTVMFALIKIFRISFLCLFRTNIPQCQWRLRVVSYLASVHLPASSDKEPIRFRNQTRSHWSLKLLLAYHQYNHAGRLIKNFQTSYVTKLMYFVTIPFLLQHFLNLWIYISLRSPHFGDGFTDATSRLW